ncbi:hypothetical protein GJAV_G00091080 [Gymnothorax javanicus]|nr:hypothetical protein GJAV_G00091080 [Gymnothorax javanicus]
MDSGDAKLQHQRQQIQHLTAALSAQQTTATGSMGQPYPPAGAAASPPPGLGQASTRAHQPEPEPMQMGHSRLTKEERDRRMRSKACLYCGQQGHFVTNCPEKSQHPLVTGEAVVGTSRPEASSNCRTCIPVTLSWGNQSPRTSALVDSGVEGNFLDVEVTASWGVPISPLVRPLTVFGLGGQRLAQILHQTAPVQLLVSGNHRETITFLIIRSPRSPVVLGHPWFREHGPVLDWSTHEVHEWKSSCSAFTTRPHLCLGLSYQHGNNEEKMTNIQLQEDVLVLSHPAELWPPASLPRATEPPSLEDLSYSSGGNGFVSRTEPMSYVTMQEQRCVLSWFQGWGVAQRERFLQDLLSKAVPGKVCTLLEQLNTLQVQDRPPNIFECQLRLWSQWFESWSEEERNAFLQALEERDSMFVGKFYNAVAGTAGRK